MAQIPVSAGAIDGFSTIFYWVFMKSGDVGDSCTVWAFNHLAFHLSGNTDRNPVEIWGSNDNDCFGLLMTIFPGPVVPPTGIMVEVQAADGTMRTVDSSYKTSGDAVVSGDHMPRCRYLRPVCGGTGTFPDTDLALFATREFGPRT